MRINGLALAAMLTAMLAASSLPAQLPSAAGNSGLYLSASGGSSVPATRLETDIEIEVTGIVARVTVSQRFRNPSRDWVEGVYVFPLPDDAAVERLTLVIGNRRIEGEIQEREQARQTYERARAAGQQASLVEQERPNLFTTSVANIAPGEEVEIEIGYLQTAAYDDGQFSLRLPLTLTPRYIPGATTAGPAIAGATLPVTPPAPAAVTDAARITPPLRRADGDSHRTSIDIAIDAGMPLAEIGSSSHPLESRRDGAGYRLSTAGQSVPLDRDLVVAWRIVTDQTPRVAAFTETRDGETYLLLMFLPPSSAELPESTPRELIFIIDTSGSMGGESIRQARAALLAGLGRLRPADRFNVIAFSDVARSLHAAPIAWSTQSLQDAARFVGRLNAEGGTNIAAALQAALAQPPADGWLRQIVFITDGSVGNEAGLFGMIREGLGAARLFTVGIGAAPNDHFMRKAAQFGRGSFAHIARPDEVEPAMGRLFAKLEYVALRDIEIEWPVGFEVYPERVPDLYRGEPVVVVARTEGNLARSLSLAATGEVGPYGWSQRFDVSPGASGGVAALWARRRIESLLDASLEGANPEAIREAVIEVALEHSLLSPFTSLVAVDRTPQRTREAALRREALGNLPPAGSEFGRFASLPATATAARWYQLIGVVLAGLALGLVGIWRLTRTLRR